MTAPERTAGRRAAWGATLRGNWAIPLLLALLWPVQYALVDAGWVDRYTLRIVMLIGINITLAVSLQLINGVSGQFSLGHAGFMAVGAYLAAYPSKLYSPQGHGPLAVLWFYVVLTLLVGVVGAALVAGFWAVRQSRRVHPALAPALLVLVPVWFVVDVAVAARIPAAAPPYLVWSHVLGWLRLGWDWLLAWGLPGALAASQRWPASIQEVLTFVLVLLGGGCFAALAGLVVGIPTLRLRGDYLAIATLGFAEIIRVVITNSQPFGGALGLNQLPHFTNLAWVYGVAVITVIVVWRLVHSARGRALLAVREDEIAAAAVGIDTTRSKVMAFVVGAFLAGVAGALFAHNETYITPQHFSFMRSVELVVMVTLAGSGSISGTILAAAVLTYLPEFLRDLPQPFRQLSEWRMVLYSLILILMMLLRPEGLLGGRELWWTRKRLVADAPATEPDAGKAV